VINIRDAVRQYEAPGDYYELQRKRRKRWDDDYKAPTRPRAGAVGTGSCTPTKLRLLNQTGNSNGLKCGM
jgi:hypothetical protein